ncbi:M14 family metallopeptidase [Alkalibacillus salilacus]|uniref:M14 family metallopeptidase n=1 Tax=Alkalibacillus salilacus TaxID=284582 RepID=UPI0027D8BA3B|nr:M14 family metallocarboxypeptidase [Alkalibacillus salilacus]
MNFTRGVTIRTVSIILLLLVMSSVMVENVINADEHEFEGIAIENDTTVYQEKNTESSVLKTYQDGTILTLTDKNDDQWFNATVKVDGENEQGFIHKDQVERIEEDQSNSSGYATEATQVYQSPTTNADVWKSYAKGNLLYYKTFSESWYEAVVIIDGEQKTGYISKSQIEEPIQDQESLTGYASKEPTPIFAKPSLDSKAIKSYEKGHYLYYKTYLSNWYEAIVYVNGERKTGYIHKDHIEYPVDESVNLSGVATLNPTNVYTDPKRGSSILKDYDAGSVLYYETFLDDWYQAIVFVDGERETGYIAKSDVQEPVENPESLSGVATKDRTKVYASANDNSDVLKDYAKGSVLYYETFLDDWYQAIVYVGGERLTGYIAKSDVQQPVENPEELSGIATKERTNVYESANSSSDVLKDYAAGSTLYYKTFIDGWYKAIVYVNGEKRTGYINSNDVEQPVENPEDLSGVALESQTNIYDKPNDNASVLKDYKAGSILYYQTFIDGWYKAIVYLNGEKHTGYINNNDVEEPTNDPQSLTGIGMKHHTHVYDTPNRDSKKLKSYDQGHQLYYETFIDGWYEAIVYVGGERQTGYIHQSDVEQPVQNQTSLTGYAYDIEAHVYASPSKHSKELKDYSEGKLLYYKTYLEDWYEAVVFVDGERRTGYIPKNEVIDSNAEQETLEGVAIRDRVHVYSEASRHSNELKGYNFGSQLMFKSFTENWYEAVFFVDGERHTGYIHKNDVSLDGLSVDPIVNPHTEYTYNQMESDIYQLADQYPGLVDYEVIGQSVDGRNLYAIRVGNGDAKVTINAAHHAREWITTNLVMDQIDTYSQAFVKGETIDGYDVREVLNKASIYYVPMVNPDGVSLVQKGASAVDNSDYVVALNDGSRDFSAWKANANGVDLNRQYPADWGTLSNTEPFPGPERYKGTEPLSEPETRALADFTLSHDFKTAVAYHSAGEILYWDYNTSGQLYDDTRRIAEMISGKTGYSLYVPYNLNGGGYKDWVLDSLGYPGYTPEVSPYVGDRPVPLSNYNRIWNQNDSIGLMLAEEAYQR